KEKTSSGVKDLHLLDRTSAGSKESIEGAPRGEVLRDSRKKAVTTIDVARAGATLGNKDADVIGRGESQCQGGAADAGAGDYAVGRGTAAHAAHRESSMEGGARTFNTPGSHRNSTGVEARGSSPSRVKGISPPSPSIRTHGLLAKMTSGTAPCVPR